MIVPLLKEPEQLIETSEGERVMISLWQLDKLRLSQRIRIYISCVLIHGKSLKDLYLIY
jgi:hypothetical protein